MQWQFLHDPYDITWLRETHKVDIVNEAKSALMIGNKDCPTRIYVFSNNDPHYRDSPLGIYEPRESDGTYILTRGSGNYMLRVMKQIELNEAATKATLEKFRDDHYRKLCDIPQEYDAVIDFIRDNNPYIQHRSLVEREEVACNSVHACISAVLFGEENASYCATGMCLGVRISRDKNQPGYKQIRLGVTSLHLMKGE